MLRIHSSCVPGGVAVTVSGMISDPGVASILVDGLACLGEDGDVVVDLTGVVLATPAAAVQLSRDVNARLPPSRFCVVCCDAATRLVLRRSGMRSDILPTVDDAQVCDRHARMTGADGVATRADRR